MEKHDYEKAKQECWRMLWREFFYDESKTQPVDREDVFNFTFNRAYRLGMEAAKKEVLTANVDSSKPNVESLERKHTEPQKDKVFDNILKRGFRNHNRLHIATQILCALIPKFENGELQLYVEDERTLVKDSYHLADMLIAESEKGGKL